MTVSTMGGELTLREVDGTLARIRALLEVREPQTFLITDQEGRCVEVDLFPDGTDWLVKVSSAGRVLWDTKDGGVALDDRKLVDIVSGAFRQLRSEETTT